MALLPCVHGQRPRCAIPVKTAYGLALEVTAAWLFILLFIFAMCVEYIRACMYCRVRRVEYSVHPHGPQISQPYGLLQTGVWSVYVASGAGKPAKARICSSVGRDYCIHTHSLSTAVAMTEQGAASRRERGRARVHTAQPAPCTHVLTRRTGPAGPQHMGWDE